MISSDALQAAGTLLCVHDNPPLRTGRIVRNRLRYQQTVLFVVAIGNLTVLVRDLITGGIHVKVFGHVIFSSWVFASLLEPLPSVRTRTCEGQLLRITDCDANNRCASNGAPFFKKND